MSTRSTDDAIELFFNTHVMLGLFKWLRQSTDPLRNAQNHVSEPPKSVTDSPKTSPGTPKPRTRTPTSDQEAPKTCLGGS